MFIVLFCFSLFFLRQMVHVAGAACLDCQSRKKQEKGCGEKIPPTYLDQRDNSSRQQALHGERQHLVARVPARDVLDRSQPYYRFRHGQW